MGETNQSLDLLRRRGLLSGTLASVIAYRKGVARRQVGAGTGNYVTQPRATFDQILVKPTDVPHSVFWSKTASDALHMPHTSSAFAFCLRWRSILGRKFCIEAKHGESYSGTPIRSFLLPHHLRSVQAQDHNFQKVLNIVVFSGAAQSG
jgi:hypothetical protein